MNKLILSGCLMYLLFVTTYLICLAITLSPKEVAFVSFLVMASALVLIMLWHPVATEIFPALVASMATLAALAHLSGTSAIIQLAFPALIAVVAICATVQLNLRLWKVFLDFVWLTGAIYLPFLGLQ